jgi:hypothetical protein
MQETDGDTQINLAAEEKRPKSKRLNILETPAFQLPIIILGLAADVISILTFIGGLWGFGEEQVDPALKPVFLGITGFVIICGWIGLTWVIAKSRGRADAATVLAGIVCYMLAWMWLLAAIRELPSDIRKEIIKISVTLGTILYVGLGTLIGWAIDKLLNPERETSWPSEYDTYYPSLPYTTGFDANTVGYGGGYFTLIHNASGTGYKINQSAIRIGRGAGNTIQLSSESVSRKHAKILWAGANYRISDLNSTNGTFVNDERLDSPVDLNDGDTLRLGDVVLTYRITFP